MKAFEDGSIDVYRHVLTHQNLDMCEKLIRHGANPTLKVPRVDLNNQPISTSALQLALANKCDAIVELFTNAHCRPMSRGGARIARQ